MWSRYSCPSCKVNLKVNLPKQTKYSWYKFNSRYTLQCNTCGAKIEKRFADFDIGLATLLTCGGVVSLWGAGKIVLPIIAVFFAIRFVIGVFLSVYVLSKK